MSEESENIAGHKKHNGNHGHLQLDCEDILFGIFDQQLRHVEPVIHKFYTDEALVLNQLSLNLSHYEQLDFVRRSHMAQKMLMYLSFDIKIKERFYN